MQIAKRRFGPRRAIKTCAVTSFIALVLLGAETARAQEWLYTVRPGDNLWNVTAEHLNRMDYWPRLQVMKQG